MSELATINPILSEQKSQEQAQYIGMLSMFTQPLDVSYLKEVLRQMHEDHLRKDTLVILNPNPITHSEKQKLYRLKINQLTLIIQLKENEEAIQNAKGELKGAEAMSDEIGKLFL